MDKKLETTMESMVQGSGVLGLGFGVGVQGSNPITDNHQKLHTSGVESPNL